MLRIDWATAVNRARTDALQRRPYCLSSEGVEREYKRTGRKEQGRLERVAWRPEHYVATRQRDTKEKMEKMSGLKPAVETGFGKQSAVPVHRRPSSPARHSW